MACQAQCDVPPVTLRASLSTSLSPSHSSTTLLASCSLDTAGTLPPQGLSTSLCRDVTLFRSPTERAPYLKLQRNATSPIMAFPITTYVALFSLFHNNYHLLTFY